MKLAGARGVISHRSQAAFGTKPHRALGGALAVRDDLNIDSEIRTVRLLAV